MIDFREADRRYIDLRRLHDNGEIDTREFRAGLEELSVQDADGRWWAKHRETGAWHYYDGDTWVPGTPPGYQEAASEPDLRTHQARTPPPQRPRTEESAEKRRRALPWVLAAAVVGVVVVGAAVAYLSYFRSGDAASVDGGDRGTAAVELPDVTGKTRAEAEQILRDRGFEVETEMRTRPDEEAGKVIGQSPSGEEAKRGSKVEITVGKAAPEEKKSASGDNPSDELATDEGPSPGYSLIQDPSGGLTVEIPEAWTVLKGADSEYPGIEVKNWSSVAGEDLTSSITATPNLGDWHDLDPPVSGTYMVASRTLAQAYTDDELIYSTLYAGQAGNCEEGPTEPLQRSSLSGKMQTWHDCRGQGITNVIGVAYPDGRECVAVVQARLASEADRDAIEHLLDTFEVDCAKVSDA